MNDGDLPVWGRAAYVVAYNDDGEVMGRAKAFLVSSRGNGRNFTEVTIKITAQGIFNYATISSLADDEDAPPTEFDKLTIKGQGLLPGDTITLKFDWTELIES